MDSSKPVSTIMTRTLVVIKPNDPIEVVHNLFEKNNFHHMPVVDHNKLVGIVSKTDYLKIRHMLATTWSGEAVCQEMYKDMSLQIRLDWLQIFSGQMHYTHYRSSKTESWWES